MTSLDVTAILLSVDHVTASLAEFACIRDTTTVAIVRTRGNRILLLYLRISSSLVVQPYKMADDSEVIEIDIAEWKKMKVIKYCLFL